MNTNIPLNEVSFRADNPRKTFSPEALAQLAESIKKIGVLEPVLVRPMEGGGFDLVAGERRCRAALAAGLSEIPALVRELSDVDVARIQLAENVARAAMNPIEEHYGVSRLIELGEEIESVCDVTGRSKEWVQLRLDLGSLPEPFKAAISDGVASLGVAEQLLRVDEASREEASQILLNLGTDATASRARDMLAMKYLEPAAKAKLWSAWLAKQDLEGEWGNCQVITEFSERREYFQSWGTPMKQFEIESEVVGRYAAETENADLTWGEVSEVLEVPLLLLPDEKGTGPIILAQKSKILDLEMARRKAGEPFTLGPRAAITQSEEERREAEADEKVAAEIDPQAIFERLSEAEQIFWRPVLTEVAARWSDDDLEGVESVFRVLNEQLNQREGALVNS